jgi:hypothetical protein
MSTFSEDRFVGISEAEPSTDIDPGAKALWPISVSRDDNSLDMEKGMH